MSLLTSLKKIALEENKFNRSRILMTDWLTNNHKSSSMYVEHPKKLSPKSLTHSFTYLGNAIRIVLDTGGQVNWNEFVMGPAQ